MNINEKFGIHIYTVRENPKIITPVPEFIDQVFAKTSPKRSFLMTENARFGLDFAKTGSINSDTALRNSTWRPEFEKYIDPLA